MLKIRKIEIKVQEGSNNINEHLTLGALYFDAGDFDKLISLYDKTLRLSLSELDKGRIYYERGEAYQLSSRYEYSIKSFEKAIKTLQNVESSWESLYIKGISSYNLFLLCLDRDKLKQYSDDAINYFNLIIDEHSVHQDIHHVYSSLADIYAKLEEYDKAEYFYSSALEQHVDDLALVQYLSGMASVYGKKSQYDKAIKHFNEALRKANKKSINTSKIYYEMGVVYLAGNFLSEAEKALQIALEEKKSDPLLKDNQEYEVDILWYLGTTAYELGNSDDDVEIYFSKVLELIDNNHFYYTSTHLTLAHLYASMNKDRKAKEHYNNVLIAPFADEEDKKMAKECLSQLSFDA